MKIRIFLLAALPIVVQADEDYVNFVRQTQLVDGVELEWEVTVDPDGTALSPTGVGEDGASFELWSIHSGTAVEYLLDEQFVTAYTPNATINILTGDPYGPVKRTRVDQPFQVQISVSGLLTPSDPAYATAPDAAKYVDYTHAAFSYPDGAHSLDGIANPVGTVIQEGWMEESADTTVTFLVCNLSGDDLTQMEGEEVFTISSQDDFGATAKVLDSNRVQIWPVATATMSGVDSNTYYEEVPPLVVTLEDLYPDSTTYVRLYPGNSTGSPTDVTNVLASYVLISDSIPQDRSMVLKDLDPYFTEEGYHTIEVIHTTPFGTEILSTVTIRVDRTIELKGGVFSQD